MNATESICIAETTNKGREETKGKHKNKETQKNRKSKKLAKNPRPFIRGSRSSYFN